MTVRSIGNGRSAARDHGDKGMTLGSLFDGAGTMPYAATLCGITPSSKMGEGGDNVPYVLYVSNSSRRDIAATLDASYYKGAGNRSGKERELVCEKVIALDRAAFNQGKNAQYDIGIDDSGIAQTCVAKGPGAVCYCLQGNGIDRHAACYADKHDYCVRTREGKAGGGKGTLVQDNKSNTLACGNDQIVFQHTETQYIVRRLTPLECCRLQGMPDGWEEGVSVSDVARYKMWGNGMALPNALYVMEGFLWLTKS